MPPAVSESNVGIGLCSNCSASNPAHLLRELGKAAEDGPSVWSLHTYTRDWEEVPGSSLQMAQPQPRLLQPFGKQISDGRPYPYPEPPSPDLYLCFFNE